MRDAIRRANQEADNRREHWEQCPIDVQFEHFMRSRLEDPVNSIKSWISTRKGTCVEAEAYRIAREWIERNRHLFKFKN
jgi:hypothetical protein